MAAQPKKYEAEFHKPGTGMVKKSVSAGDVLKYVGKTERVKVPTLKSRTVFDRSTGLVYVLVGAPPEGMTIADLHAAGVGATVHPKFVNGLSSTQQWALCSAAEAKKVKAAIDKAHADRVKASTKKDDAK